MKILSGFDKKAKTTQNDKNPNQGTWVGSSSLPTPSLSQNSYRNLVDAA